MFKKFIVILVLFILVIAGLQLFGGRDFGQVNVAWKKYQYGGDLGSLSEDIGSIFAGDKVNQGGLESARMAERLMYRWTDDKGVVHMSERMPKDGKYEVIRMGDLKIETQKALDEEEIKKALNDN
jgi:hypothetical protein